MKKTLCILCFTATALSLTANNSEALVIEGQNSIALENCDVNGSVLNGTINFNGYTITLADGTVLK